MTTLLTAILSLALFAGAPHTVWLPTVQAPARSSGIVPMNCAQDEAGRIEWIFDGRYGVINSWWVFRHVDGKVVTIPRFWPITRGPTFVIGYLNPQPGYRLEYVQWSTYFGDAAVFGTDCIPGTLSQALSE